MLRIFRKPESDTSTATVGRSQGGSVVTFVPEFDCLTPIGLERSVPNKADYRLMVRQLIADHAASETLSGAGAALLDRLIEDWQRQWDVAAHEAYLSDLTGVDTLIASQAMEHARRAAATVDSLRQRRGEAEDARTAGYHELVGYQPEATVIEPSVVQLPVVLSRHAVEAIGPVEDTATTSQPPLFVVERTGS